MTIVSTPTPLTTGFVVAEGVWLDLGHTELVGTLVLDDDGLVVINPSGKKQLLGRNTMAGSIGGRMQAHRGHLLLEESGLLRNLPAALVGSGICEEIARHEGISDSGYAVIELRISALVG